MNIQKLIFGVRSEKPLKQGTSLIDVVAGVSLLVVIFFGIFGAFKLSIELVSTTKARTGAIALANEQMEYIRSLPYEDVGTIGGIPAGIIEEEETISLNLSEYTRRTLILYTDAPEDGLGGLDENGITTDYKAAKVKITWTLRGKERSFSLVSNIVPKGIETTGGGGTLTINVIDAVALSVANASVHVYNDNVSPTVDVTAFSNSEGTVSFLGTPEASNYEIIVTKAGFSTAQTYTADAGNPNPSPGHLSVIEGETTVASFAIDRVSTKIVRTFEPVGEGSWSDTFADSTKLSASTSVSVFGDSLTLFDDGSGYALNGSAFSDDIAPSLLSSWDEFSWNDNVPVDTEVLYKLYFYNQVPDLVLIPNTALPGNEEGFIASPIDISGLDIETYGTLQMAAFLGTTDASTTPKVFDWEVSYFAGPTPFPNIPFAMRGNKTIGSDPFDDPIYKYEEDLQTDGAGSITIENLEWDNYTITIDNISLDYDISESCTPQPRSIAPNMSQTTDLYLVPHTTNTLLVDVKDENDNLLSGANVRLFRTPGIDMTQSTGTCGQTFFENLSSGTVVGGDPYSVHVSLSGYSTETLNNVVDVTGQSTLSVVLNSI